MTTEEKFNQDVWLILQKIKEKYLATPKKQPPQPENIYLGVYADNTKPHGVEIWIHNGDKFNQQRNIIHKLKEQGVLKILDETRGDFNWEGTRFILKILQPKFDEVYREYEKSQQPPPNLSADFSLTRKAQTEALKRALVKAEERESIKKEIIEELKGEQKESQEINDQRGGDKPEKQTKKNKDTVGVKTKSGLLTFNKRNGFVSLGKVKSDINPQSRESKTLLKLMTGKEYLATYEDLLGDKASITTKRELSFVVRNIKKVLGILPAKKHKNNDCIKNIKNYGYKLIV